VVVFIRWCLSSFAGGCLHLGGRHGGAEVVGIVVGVNAKVGVGSGGHRECGEW
jgi:hypothetical protein